MMVRSFILIVVAVATPLSGNACGGDPPSPQELRAIERDKVGDIEVLQGVLFGSQESCREPFECVLGVCLYGRCTGLMYVERPWLQQELAEDVAALSQSRPLLRSALVEQLAKIVGRDDTDLGAKARAVRGLEAMGSVEPLRAAQASAPDAVAETIALALCRLKDPAGLAHTAALTEDPALPVAVEALHALGDSGLPAALPILLRSLHASLDAAIVRGALEGLRRLGDKRAVTTLVAFLDTVPEALAVRTARVLASLTGEARGADPDGWRVWLAAHPMPPPPPFTPRVFSPEDDLGLPTP